MMWVENDMGALANRYFSRVDAVFYHDDRIRNREDLLALAGTPGYFFIDGFRVPEEYLTAEVVEGLFLAVAADCEAGNMTQQSAYHQGFVVDREDCLLRCIRLDLDLADRGVYLEVYADSENCMRFLEESGILSLYMDSLGSENYYK